MANAQVWIEVTAALDGEPSVSIGGPRLVLTGLTETLAAKLAVNLAAEIADIVRIADGDNLTVTAWTE